MINFENVVHKEFLFTRNLLLIFVGGEISATVSHRTSCELVDKIHRVECFSDWRATESFSSKSDVRNNGERYIFFSILLFCAVT